MRLFNGGGDLADEGNQQITLLPQVVRLPALP